MFWVFISEMVILLFTLTKCIKCGAPAVINVSVDVDPNRKYKVENIVITESTKESDFVDCISNLLNNRIKSGAQISNVRKTLIDHYGISESYSTRLESLILPKLIPTPAKINI